jgi:prepilin-type N-terminal cleavage/methylation domain-containing protein
MVPHGFTIIEILLVIAIILVLAAILFPVLSRARDQGKMNSALQQMQQLGLAFTLYGSDADGNWPPATNYGLSETSGARMWTSLLKTYASSTDIFVAPGSNGIYTTDWLQRGAMTIGMNSATSVDIKGGCDSDVQPANGYQGCQAFDDIVDGSEIDSPSLVGIFAVTPGGDTNNRYRGYEFNPYNGHVDPVKPWLGPPLVSDRDLVKELSFVPGKLLKPIYCRYMSTGYDDGLSPVVFADGHSKSFVAKMIAANTPGIIWRFR